MTDRYPYRHHGPAQPSVQEAARVLIEYMGTPEWQNVVDFVGLVKRRGFRDEALVAMRAIAKETDQ